MVARQHHDFTYFRFSSLLFLLPVHPKMKLLLFHFFKFGMTWDWFLGVLSQILTLMVSCPSNQAGTLQFAFRMLPLNRFEFIVAARSCCVKGGTLESSPPIHPCFLIDLGLCVYFSHLLVPWCSSIHPASGSFFPLVPPGVHLPPLHSLCKTPANALSLRKSWKLWPTTWSLWKPRLRR